MVALRFERVLALPSPAIANTVYFVRPTGAEIALQYVTGNDGIPVLVGGAGAVTPTPTPAPVFTSEPSLSPQYVVAGNPITITPGVITGATSVARAALLNGAALTITNNTVTPSAAGTLTYQETATGPGGTTLSLLRSATVAAAPIADTGGVTVSRSVRRVSGSLAEQFSISRTGDTSGPKTATWQASASTLPGRVATRAADFGGTYPTGTVTWAAGATDVKTITVTPTNSNVLPE